MLIYFFVQARFIELVKNIGRIGVIRKYAFIDRARAVCGVCDALGWPEQRDKRMCVARISV